jgi:riboflavin synthase
MFTGIVHEKVPIRTLRFDPSAQSCVVRIESSHPQRRLWNLGDSIALDGVCLTIAAIEHSENSSLLSFDVSKETLAKSHWGKSFQREHRRVKVLHLEPALRLGDPMGGHVVSGHVETVGVLEQRKEIEGYLELSFSISRNDKASAFLIEKGSVALDGVSLTVNRVWDEPGKTFFTVFLIPHTLEKCHFASLEVGDLINIESDLMARHYCRYQELRQ